MRERLPGNGGSAEGSLDSRVGSAKGENSYPEADIVKELASVTYPRGITLEELAGRL